MCGPSMISGVKPVDHRFDGLAGFGEKAQGLRRYENGLRVRRLTEAGEDCHAAVEALLLGVDDVA